MITLNDITDKILPVDFDDIEEANSYLARLAQSFDVTIVLPVSATVKQLGIAYACYSRSLKLIGADATATLNGSRSEDIYAIKRKTYLEEMKRLEAVVKAGDFDSNYKKKGAGIVTLQRS